MIMCFLTLFSLFLALPAYAGVQDGDTPLAVFTVGNLHPRIVTTKINNIQPPAIAVEFVPVDGDRCADNYVLVDGQLTHTPPQPPPPDTTSPLPEQFLDAIADHPSAPVQIYQYLPYIARYASQPVRRKALWAKVIANPPAWLTAQVIAAIEAAAVEARMPLK